MADVERLRRGWERTGEAFLRRIFTSHEIGYCRGFADPWPHLAARFAAKESVMKALGTPLEPRGIEIWRAGTGQPRVVFLGSAKTATESRGVAEVKLSISHSAGVAVAFAIAFG